MWLTNTGKTAGLTDVFSEELKLSEDDVFDVLLVNPFNRRIIPEIFKGGSGNREDLILCLCVGGQRCCDTHSCFVDYKKVFYETHHSKLKLLVN